MVSLFGLFFVVNERAKNIFNKCSGRGTISEDEKVNISGEMHSVGGMGGVYKHFEPIFIFCFCLLLAYQNKEKIKQKISRLMQLMSCP